MHTTQAITSSSLKKSRFPAHETQLNGRPILRWQYSANRTEAAAISSLASRAGLTDVQVWVAANASNLTPIDFERLLETVASVRELGASGALSAQDLQQRVTELQTVALAYDKRPWTEARINLSVDCLAAKLGITAPNVIAVMKSCLTDPGMTREQRAAALGLTLGAVARSTNHVRAALGSNGSEQLRISVANAVGMPLSAVAARVRLPEDPNLAGRVMNTINESHRDGVAELLLTVLAGSEADAAIYRFLGAVFEGGDPFDGSVGLSKLRNVAERLFEASEVFLRRTFSGDRMVMLRTMGFGYEQIMSMNPVGAEVARRLDPALGTYSAAETATRREKNLPCTREEAAERLLVAGTDRARGGKLKLSYRNWLAVGLVSDKPSMMPADIGKAYSTLLPNTEPSAGVKDLSQAFRIAQSVLGREIPRGSRPDLMGREYRQEVNLLLLQIFGLGATRVGSSRFEAIPTDFKISDWPSPDATSSGSAQKVPRTDRGSDDVTWQQLLPLLQRRPVQ